MAAWQILAGLALIVAGLGIVWRLTANARKGGAAEAVKEQQGEVIDAIADRKEVEADVDRLNNADARDRLSKWSRD